MVGRFGFRVSGSGPGSRGVVMTGQQQRGRQSLARPLAAAPPSTPPSTPAAAARASSSSSLLAASLSPGKGLGLGPHLEELSIYLSSTLACLPSVVGCFRTPSRSLESCATTTRPTNHLSLSLSRPHLSLYLVRGCDAHPHQLLSLLSGSLVPQ